MRIFLWHAKLTSFDERMQIPTKQERGKAWVGYAESTDAFGKPSRDF